MRDNHDDESHDLALPESACPQAGCLLECFDAAGIALDCRCGTPAAVDDAWEDTR